MGITSKITLIIIGFVLLDRPYANVIYVSYTGGKQTGTFKIVGDLIPPPANYLDTVIIDSNLLITNFDAATQNNYPSCAFVPKDLYGFYIGSKNGSQGRLGGGDSIWSNATSYPGSLLPLDSIPEAGFTSNKIFPNNPRGINADTIMTGGECQNQFYGFISSYSGIIYFQYNNGDGERYGKLMIYGYEESFNTSGLVNNISNYDFAYTISSTTDLNSGTVSVYPFRKTSPGFPSTHQFFDPLGRHILESALPKRDFISIPLLFQNAI